MEGVWILAQVQGQVLEELMEWTPLLQMMLVVVGGGLGGRGQAWEPRAQDGGCGCGPGEGKDE